MAGTTVDRLESLAVSVRNCDKVVLRALPSLHGLRELHVGFTSEENGDYSFRLAEFLTVVHTSGLPSSALRFGPGVSVSIDDDAAAAAKAAAQLITAGRISCLELNVKFTEGDQQISVIMRPVLAALQSTGEAAAPCGVRPGSRFKLTAASEEGDLGRDIGFICEGPLSAR